MDYDFDALNEMVLDFGTTLGRRGVRRMTVVLRCLVCNSIVAHWADYDLDLPLEEIIHQAVDHRLLAEIRG